jgi:magnesium-transporting ATPase (P-type)
MNDEPAAIQIDTPPQQPKRPLGITLLGWLSVLGIVLWVFIWLAVIWVVIYLADPDVFNDPELQHMYSIWQIIPAWAILLVVGIGVLQLVLAVLFTIGFFKLKRWLPGLYIAVLILAVVEVIALYLYSLSHQDPAANTDMLVGCIGILISFLILLYVRKHKALFVN